MSRRGRPAGELAIVLHTHMPYVEGFGTWPFGEEWLWEAIATSYLPLLEMLGRVPLTLSLTPVLCDQLAAPGTLDRCLHFLRQVRQESHQRDRDGFRAAEAPRFVAELERSAAEYVAAADRLEALPGGLLGALGAHASWTSAATHPVLPLLASDAGIALQVQTGIASHRRRFGGWSGGFWLPECAYATWLDRQLLEAGVRCTCVELPAELMGAEGRCLRPLETEEGLVLWPIDREVISLVWSERGYPAAAAYRNYHGLTFHHHRVWRNDGQPYDPEAATALVAEHAHDFVRRVAGRVRKGGVSVCALDTELLGHWWYEGIRWLEAVVEEAARQELTLTTLDDALERHEPSARRVEVTGCSWGEGGDLRTWSGPAVAQLAWQSRSAELRVLRAGRTVPERALRELMALQASDWAFMAWRGMAAEYPFERARGHAEALQRALAAGARVEDALRSLAPELVGWSA